MDCDEKGFISFEQWISEADADAVEAVPFTSEKKSHLSLRLLPKQL